MTEALAPDLGGHLACMNGIQAVGGRRLCGSGRTAGELYLECGLVRGGSPIEDRLMDLPLEVDPVEMGVSAIGISTFTDEHGVTHVLDWVGADSYPEMADFIEEARRKGVSRKVSRTAPLGDRPELPVPPAPAGRRHEREHAGHPRRLRLPMREGAHGARGLHRSGLARPAERR
ncbi:hypothetical protein [Deinococcus sedimenti]|uniref:hypothetical protein n=1 Tax=Deinococcus sedimenti TaxID=1867090 RepID=UPI001E291865|nr:hypothetical protein [Deinococcus sedimenti]